MAYTRLPAFGLIGAISLCLVVVPGWNEEFWRPIPVGLAVQLLNPTPLSTKTDDWNEALVVRVDSQRRFYLNSKKVSEEELAGNLREALSRRAEWVVFVEGDPTLEYAYVAHAVDIVTGMHARVILLTYSTQRGEHP
jgi:biopolymer transport protein ExbD